jgi:hypothetical protein
MGGSFVQDRPEHRAPSIRQGDVSDGVALDQPFTTMAVTVSPGMQSVSLAAQNSSNRSRTVSAGSCMGEADAKAAGRSGWLPADRSGAL